MQLFHALDDILYIRSYPVLSLFKRKKAGTERSLLFQHLLAILTLVGYFMLFADAAAAQQDDKPAKTSQDTQLGIDAKNTLSSGMADQATVLILYSSQACAFCPAADRFFARLIAQTDIIGLACHVDYFDVSTGALSEAFCSKRQQRQVAHISGAFVYTPQMIINGRYDVLGHKHQHVSDQLIAAVNKDTVIRLDITKNQNNKGMYRFTLPQRDMTGEGSLWLAVYNEPHRLEIAGGANKGRNMQYVHIVSVLKKLGRWDGSAKVVKADLAPRDTHAGFVVLAEDAKGRIQAAGEHHFGNSRPVK